MKIRNLLSINYYLLALTSFFLEYTQSLKPCHDDFYSTEQNRSSFPAGFLFGAGSSAYQKKFLTIARNVADEFYYLYKEDIARMKNIGLDTFRISISWPRVLPRIQPSVTLFHRDLPQALEDEYGGFLSPKIVDDHRDYANFCFQEFGDRVNRGNSATEPYLVTHHLILSHANAVKLYRDKNQTSQKGIVGITVNSIWQVPKFQIVSSRKAALRALDFQFGWVVHPMTNGDYPKTMRCLVGNRLPNFTNEESILMKGTLYFVGLNYYTSLYAADATSYSSVFLSYTTDSHVNDTAKKNGIPIGEPAGGNRLYMYPKGIREIVLYVKRKYSDLLIYITENGMADNNNNSLPIDEALDDDLRIKYHHRHLSYLLQAIKIGKIHNNGIKTVRSHGHTFS
ncbi:hypothetical protein QYF36_002527 [Acer negundo]|nr:hypothetical protein QYF36_002527 [Acer negundo]